MKDYINNDLKCARVNIRGECDVKYGAFNTKPAAAATARSNCQSHEPMIVVLTGTHFTNPMVKYVRITIKHCLSLKHTREDMGHE